MTADAKAAYQIASYLEKMSSTDKDFRFMAVSDLMNEFIKNNVRLDEDSERKVIRMLLRLLEDKNGEVQNLAVRCLSTMAPRVREISCESVVDSLCDNMARKADELREVSSTALSGFVKTMPPGIVSTKIAIRLLPKLHGVLAALSAETAAKNEVLDIIGEVLSRNGTSLAAHHQETERVLLEHVCEGRASVRKRAIGALSQLCLSANADLYNDIVDKLLANLAAPRADIRILVCALTSLLRSCPSRFSSFIPTVAPLFLKYCDAEDDELREVAIQGVEALITRCPKESTPYFAAMEKKLTEALVYDPNYSYDDDDECEEMETGYEEGEEEEDDDYEDDDDLSWKVRRAASKGIEAMIETRREEQASLANSFGPLLISRFKEREENVKSDIFSAYSAIIKRLEASRDPAVGTVVNGQLPALLKAMVRNVKGKNSKSRQLAFGLLSILAKVLPGSLESSMGVIVESAVLSLGDKSASSQMKMDVLFFLEQAILSHPPQLFLPQTAQLVQAVSRCVADPFYKVSSQALVVSSLVLDVLKAQGDVRNEQVDTLCSAIFNKLKGDVDQEVKEKAILAMGSLLKNFAMGDKSEELLKVLIERVSNEATQLSALKALSMIVDSEKGVCMHPLLNSLVPLLSQMLRKNSRALKISSLSLILSLLTRFHSDIPADFVPALHTLLSETDLQISQLALKTLTGCAFYLPSQLGDCLQDVLSSVVRLSKSSILQGTSLATLLEFVTALVQNPVPGRLSFEALLDLLSSPVYTEPLSLSRQALHSIASLVATVAAVDTNKDNAPKLAEKLKEQLGDRKTSETTKIFALLTLGELGRRCPNIYGNNTALKPEELIVCALNSANEDIKSAASLALGGLAVGNLSVYLPFLLEQVTSQPKRQYMLLHALKEVIACETSISPANPSFVSQVDAVWEVLMKHADCAEEGTRCVVAECLGKLCNINPEVLLPRLREHINSPSLNMRAAVVTSVKFMITDEPRPIDEYLHAMMADFLSTAEDANLDVRRVALVVLNSAAHNKPNLIRSLLGRLQPIVYKETNVRQDLIREVEMGPFKHSVDDGLDLRKSAFECMYTLLDSCLDQLDIFSFIEALENGLKDQHDIKLLSYLTLGKLTVLRPNEVAQRIDKICEPLKAQLMQKLKPNSVKQEVDKAEELKRAVLRAIIALVRLPESSRLNPLRDLLEMIKHQSELKLLFESLQKEVNRGSYGLDSIDN